MPALTEANDIIRARNVTASECGALLGKHPYTSKAKIYDRLTNPDYQKVQQNEAMRIGTYLEPHVARFAAQKLGMKVRAFTKTVEHPLVPLCATPDYYVLGQNMLMEIKVSSITYGWTADDLHPHYQWQARAQMACTNRDVCIIAVLVGSAFYTIPVVRDAAKEAMLTDAVVAFFANHVLPGVRPDDTPTPPTAVVS